VSEVVVQFLQLAKDTRAYIRGMIWDAFRSDDSDKLQRILEVHTSYFYMALYIMCYIIHPSRLLFTITISAWA
jgi:hypothetical protein